MCGINYIILQQKDVGEKENTNLEGLQFDQENSDAYVFKSMAGGQLAKRTIFDDKALVALFRST